MVISFSKYFTHVYKGYTSAETKYQVRLLETLYKHIHKLYPLCPKDHL